MPRNEESIGDNSCDDDSIKGITLDGYETDNQRMPKESNVVTNAKSIKRVTKKKPINNAVIRRRVSSPYLTRTGPGTNTSAFSILEARTAC